MNRFLPNFKSQILQVMRAPKDKRLLKHFYDSLDRFKSIEETDFWESFYELTHSRKWNFPQICDEYVLGNFFPRQCSEIGDKMEILFSRNIQYEIRWWIACFQLCAKQLNFFIESRRQYDTYILLGEYEKALQTLNSLEQQIGVSFWFYESKIFVYSRLGMDVKDLVQKLPSNSNTSIINFYVMKNLDTVTYTEYTKILENALKSNDDADFVTYIKYRLLPMEYEMESKDYLPIMMCANDCPLVDRYLIFLDIFENILLQDLSQYKFILSRYTVHLEGVNDERLQAMCFCVGSLQDRLKYKAKHKLLKAKEYLIAGDIGKCQDIAVEYLEKCPYCLQAINIVAESEIKLQNRCVQFEGTILREILDSIEFVYIMQEGWKQKLFALKKLFNCCNMSVWAQELNASVTNSYTSLENEYYLIRRKKMCLQFLDIETICECLSREDALEYLSQWFTENKYIRFRYVLLERDYGQADGLVENIDIKCIIGIRDANKDYNEKKMHLNMVIDSGNTFWIRASKYYLSSLDEKTQFMEVMQFAVSLLTENMDKALFIPWRVYIDIIENSDGEIRSNICVPILYFIQYKYSGMETKDDLSLMCEDFLYFQGKEQPSLLNVHSDLYPKKALVFFLRYICVPDILSTALASVIKNSMDLWKERIDICQILCNIDAANERIYEEEIRILTQKRKIYSELKIIEENRIHVNTEEMRPRLMEELEGDFVRYKLYLDKRWLELLETVTQKKSQSVVVLSREPERVLKELIEKIRDAFVSSTEYGLDLTLSLSIRHGAIGDVLRRPLANAELNTIYNEKEEAYEWNHKLPREMTKEEREVIKSAIIRLNRNSRKLIPTTFALIYFNQS